MVLGSSGWLLGSGLFRVLLHCWQGDLVCFWGVPGVFPVVAMVF